MQVELSYQQTKSPLQLLVDSTGIKFLGEGEWKRKKHGAEYRREWRKAHLGIDAQTLEIRAIEVTSNAIGDAPSCWPKSRSMSLSKASALMAPTTREAV